MYDNAGNVVQRTDANGTVPAAVANSQTGKLYDGFSRPYSFSYTVASGNPYNVATTPQVYFIYDVTYKGALSSVSSSASMTSYTYDNFGRITASTQTTGGTAYTFGYGYSLTDQLTCITYPSGRQVNYVLDAADRVMGVQNMTTGTGSPCQTVQTNYATVTYYAPGNISTLTLDNGVSQQVSWNDRLQPVGITAASGQNTLLSLGFFPCTGGATSCTTGNNGNLRSQTIGSPLSVTQTYTYDSVNRLTQAQESGSPSWTQGYGYDNFGNRWVGTNTGLPSLSSETPQTQSWFTSGNRISNAGANPAWGYGSGLANTTYTTTSFDALTVSQNRSIAHIRSLPRRALHSLPSLQKVACAAASRVPAVQIDLALSAYLGGGVINGCSLLAGNGFRDIDHVMSASPQLAVFRAIYPLRCSAALPQPARAMPVDPIVALVPSRCRHLRRMVAPQMLKKQYEKASTGEHSSQHAYSSQAEGNRS